MAIISKRKRILLAGCMVAGLSHAFVSVPPQLVPPLSTQPWTESGHGMRHGKHTAAGRPLQLFWRKEDPTSDVEKKADYESATLNPFQNFFSFDSYPNVPQDEELIGGGRFSIVLSRAESVIRPAAEVLDNVTNGWALTYADLSPETESTPVGQAFLASNIAYAAAGIALSLQGDLFLGLVMELVSVASFIYHYTQLDSKTNGRTVRVALFIDYVMAFSSIFIGLGYLWNDGQVPPLDGLINAALAITFFLLGCTVCAEGRPYVVVHSFWHLFSAACAYSIGYTHLHSFMS